MESIYRRISIFTLSITIFILSLSVSITTNIQAMTQNTQSNGTFIVGMECAAAPYNYTTSEPSKTAFPLGSGYYCDGFDVRVARHLAERMNKELIIQKIAWEGLIPSLESHQIDAIISVMSPTPERKQVINFSDVYFRNKFGVIVRNESTYANAKTINDFAGAKITAQLGTLHYDLIEQLPGVEALTPMKDFPTMIVVAKSGEMDGFISDDVLGEAIDADNKDLKFIVLEGNNGFETTDEQAGLAVGLRKEDTALLTNINQIFAEMGEKTFTKYMHDAIATQPFDVTGVQPSFIRQIRNLWEQYHPMFINGTIVTLLIAITATILGFIVGLLMSILRTNKFAKHAVTFYVTVIRGTPMMVQAAFIFYGIAFAIDGFQWSNIPHGKTIAGIIVVTINTGAYMTETIRSGIQAIDIGQFEAAKSLGFTRWQTMTNIILPQAIRNVLPAIGNEFIVNIKDTSVLNVIGVVELFFMSTSVSGASYKFFPTFTITAMIYLILTTIFSLILDYIEKHFWETPKS